jgi:hypothetical protein
MSGSSDKSDKKYAKPAAHPSGATDLRARVPAMTDDALATLQANARRMLDTGNAAQRNAATDLIPVIEGEIADRRAKKVAAQPARKAAAAAKVRKAKAAKPEADDED